jgi:hypothetical protein
MKTAERTRLEPYVPQVACDLAAAHGESDEARIVQVQPGDQGVQVLGQRVIVVAGSRLA